MSFFNLQDVVCSSLVQKICSFGSTCLINQFTNHVKCECDIGCDINEMSSNVCGSDGITYKSICHLKQTKCLLQKSIKIVNHDSCGKLFICLKLRANRTNKKSNNGTFPIYFFFLYN